MKNTERFPLVQQALSENLGTTNDINDIPLIDEYKLSINSSEDKRNPNTLNIVATIKNKAGEVISMNNDQMFKNDEEFQKYFDVTKRVLAEQTLKDFPQGLRWVAGDIRGQGINGTMDEGLADRKADRVLEIARVVNGQDVIQPEKKLETHSKEVDKKEVNEYVASAGNGFGDGFGNGF